MPQLIDILKLPAIFRTGMMQNSYGVTCYKGKKYYFVILYILFLVSEEQVEPRLSSISPLLFII